MGYAGANGNAIWRVERYGSWGRTTYQFWRVQISGMNILVPNDDYMPEAFDVRTLGRAFRPESLDDISMLEWYHAYGFPMRSLRCEVHWVTQSNNAVTWRCDGGVIVNKSAGGTVSALPLRPMVLGFAVDTLCFARSGGS